MNKILPITISVLCGALMLNAYSPFDAYSLRVILTSLFIQVFSIFNIFSRTQEPYSLNKIVNLFILLFLGIAPLLQFYNSQSFWGSRPLFEHEYFYTNIIIFVILLLYTLSYNLFRKLKITFTNKRQLTKLTIPVSLTSLQTMLLLSISAVSFIIVFSANNKSLISMFFRGGEFYQSTIESSTIGLIVLNFIRPLSMMSLLYYIIIEKKNYIIFSLLFLFTLITCFPLGMPRFSAAAMYIPLILLLIPFVRRKNVFSLIFIFAFLLIFPFLDNFRYFTVGKTISFNLNFNMFLEGHFDNYQNLALIISNNIITYGRQLIGVLLFWVPRSFWPNKPVGSGAYTAEILDFNFSNISANYFGEGYINFGFFGMLLFVLFLAFITAKMDKLYWVVLSSQKNNYYKIIYMLLLGLLFFFLRGDMMSAFAFTVGFLFSAFLVLRVIRFHHK